MSPPHRGGPAEVVTLGECMASFVALERGPLADTARHMRTTVAGAEANVAVGLSRLDHRAAYIGRVGDDGLGRMIMRTLRGEGVDVRELRVDSDSATGIMIRELRDLGPAEIVYWRAGSAGSQLSADDGEAAAELFDGARWLHLTGITPALFPTAAEAVEAALARAEALGLTRSLDVNMRRRLWSEAEARPVLAAIASRCEVVLGGLDEVALITGLDDPGGTGALDPEAAADAVLAMGPAAVVVKLGADGALERRRTVDGPVTERAAALAVAQVHDPVGAGDAFTAGYIAARLEGRSTAEALRMANACGAAAVSSVGDQSGLPTRPELGRLLVEGGPDALR
ncbi:sugar kinase [soil metagenome]